ncbi:IPT/TIG domain-containing protein [Nocardia lijiangensis]|uniref:IPT/TIG domain-containing protein n=1 Tax=Nocardia lijiangensis TaxID=299618 RepID=UPI003D725826
MRFFRWPPVRRLLTLIPLPFATGPRIDGFSPSSGWHGSTVQITGKNFAGERDANQVTIGGVPALVLQSGPDRLLVMVGEAATSGAVTVEVAGHTHTASDSFKILEWPDPGKFGEDGPPGFFHGPQHGTPVLGVKDQRVLVILCFPTDHDPGTPSARQTLRASVTAKFDEANRFWKEASYGSTTWDFDFTDWLALPNDRDYYVWQQDDIDRARLALFGATRRGSAVLGTTIYSGTRGGIQVFDASDGTHPVWQREVTMAAMPTGLRVAGSLLYAGCGSDGLYVLDVSAPLTPTMVSRNISSRWLNDLDIDGNLLVAAAWEGIIVYDLADPRSPVQISTLAFGGEVATAVRIVGTTAYVAAADTLQVVDLSIPAAPTVAGFVSTDRWAMDLDVDGSVCAVATDGDGLHLYDVTTTTPTLSGKLLSALRLHGVDLAGATAYVAATDDGLRIVDVSNPVVPVDQGDLVTSEPAFDIVIDSGNAIVSFGAASVALIDVSNPNVPDLSGVEELPTVDEPTLSTLRAALAYAIDQQRFRQGNALFVHAFEAARATGFDLNTFDGLVVVVNGPRLRGESSLKSSITDRGVTVTFKEVKGLIYLAADAGSGLIAHEIGHWLGMGDNYKELHSDGTYTPGTAERWCLSGKSGEAALFCGQQIHEVMGFYNTTIPNVNVAERSWSPTAPELNETFDIVAHHLNEDTTPGQVHLVKLVVAEGLVYYVEVRQMLAGAIFDQQIPVPSSATASGLVVVTRATPGISDSPPNNPPWNTLERSVMLVGELDVGDRAVDAARRLTIEVESLVQNNPLIFRVRVRWNQPIAGDPSGMFDLSIMPWSTGTWETVDVWVDSSRNSFGTFEFHEPGKVGKPILNGDRPWVNHVNRIYARVRNTGVVDAHDVYISFYVNSPPGLGGGGDWLLLGTQHIPTITAFDPAVPGTGEAVVYQEWIPAGSGHTCLKVAILPQIGEIEVNNNSAQENVAVFDSAASSSHEPIVLDAEVRNPFSVWRKVDLIVRELPEGWHAVVDKSWTWVGPFGAQAVSAIVWTDLGTPAATGHQNIPSLALPRVEGWTDFDHRYLPIGGILAAVKANQRVVPTCTIGVVDKALTARGCLDPPLAGVPITVEVVDSSGRSRCILLTTDANGCFDLADAEPRKVRLLPGKHRVQVFVTAGGDAAETSCEPVDVEVE